MAVHEACLQPDKCCVINLKHILGEDVGECCNVTSFPSQPHLIEHRELHPWLEVGRDISELIKATLLLLTHAVIKCCRALRHTICNIYTEVKQLYGGDLNNPENKSQMQEHPQPAPHQILSSNTLFDIPSLNFPTD